MVTKELLSEAGRSHILVHFIAYLLASN